MWNECNCAVFWTFFGIDLLWDWNENWSFSVLYLLSFKICWHNECSTFTTSPFRIWNSSAVIPSPPLALFIVMLPKAHLTLYTWMSGSISLPTIYLDLCVHVKLLQLCPALCHVMDVTYQAPQSMGFSMQENWNGLPRPTLGDLPDPGIEPESLMSPALAGGLFTTNATWEAPFISISLYCLYLSISLLFLSFYLSISVFYFCLSISVLFLSIHLSCLSIYHLYCSVPCLYSYHLYLNLSVYPYIFVYWLICLPIYCLFIIYLEWSAAGNYLDIFKIQLNASALQKSCLHMDKWVCRPLKV